MNKTKRAETQRQWRRNEKMFIACYKGKPIAWEQSFGELVSKKKVKRLLGNKDLLIKHTNPNGMIVVY